MPEPKTKKRAKPRHAKDRVLQARIPKHLDEELRGRAEHLGLSVSTVVRNVLLNTFDLVEGVVADSSNLARAIQGRRPRPQSQRLDKPAEDVNETGVIGWQEAVLNRNGVCEQCNAILHRGERAAIGVPLRARPVMLCPACLAALATADQNTRTPKE